MTPMVDLLIVVMRSVDLKLAHIPRDIEQVKAWSFRRARRRKNFQHNQRLPGMEYFALSKPQGLWAKWRIQECVRLLFEQRGKNHTMIWHRLIRRITVMLFPFLSLNTSCGQALQAARAKLSEAGFAVVQTFNLNTARLGLHDGCCPIHGTDTCDCQMIILLVYGEAAAPATLILHGNNGQTSISMADSMPERGEAKLIGHIRNLLEAIKRETTSS